MNDIKQTDFDAFTSHTLDVANSLVEVREYLDLDNDDDVSDDEIREAMRKAAKSTSYPLRTVVLTINTEVNDGRSRPLSGAVWAAADVQATVELDDEVVHALQDDMPDESGSLTQREPDSTDWVEFGAYLLPRKDGGYEAHHAEAAVDYGERIGTLYAAA